MNKLFLWLSRQSTQNALVFLQSSFPTWDFSGGSMVKNLPSNAGDTGWIPGQESIKIPNEIGQLSLSTAMKSPWARTEDPTHPTRILCVTTKTQCSQIINISIKKKELLPFHFLLILIHFNNSSSRHPCLDCKLLQGRKPAFIISLISIVPCVMFWMLWVQPCGWMKGECEWTHDLLYLFLFCYSDSCGPEPLGQVIWCKVFAI